MFHAIAFGLILGTLAVVLAYKLICLVYIFIKPLEDEFEE